MKCSAFRIANIKINNDWLYILGDVCIYNFFTINTPYGTELCGYINFSNYNFFGYFIIFLFSHMLQFLQLVKKIMIGINNNHYTIFQKGFE